MYLAVYKVNSFVLVNRGNRNYFINKPNGGIWVQIFVPLIAKKRGRGAASFKDQDFQHQDHFLDLPSGI